MCQVSNSDHSCYLRSRQVRCTVQFMSKDDQALRLQIGGRVRSRRRQLDLTQEQLAAEASLSKSFVSEIESGQATASGLMYLKLAKALDVDIRWLLTGEESEGPAAPQGPEPIPPLLSEIADAKGWSYKTTLDVAAALNALVARRTRDGRPWTPTRDVIERLEKALELLEGEDK
jgi:DNA-binding XRE family transcriptional regulator